MGMDGLSDSASAEFHRELRPLMCVLHPNVVNLLGYSDEGENSQCLVLPRMEPVNGELLRQLPISDIKRVLCDVAKGLAYIVT